MDWISIEEALPQPNQYIVIWNKEIQKPLTFYVHWHFVHYTNFVEYFTHWIALPKEPDE
jgi:hypothetical protein